MSTLSSFKYYISNRDPDNNFKYFKLILKIKCRNRHYRLGELYYIGDVVKLDKLAFKYFKLSADQENRIAQYRVAYMYEHGTIQPINN